MGSAWMFVYQGMTTRLFDIYGTGEHKGELPELWLRPVVGLASSAAALAGAPTHAEPVSLGRGRHCCFSRACLL